jgi:hydrogenase maturation protein HypF
MKAKFHNTVCEATIDCVCKIRNRCGIDDIVLGGGVFENAYLLRNIKRGLKKHSFNIYHNMRTPTNDGGIPFGQVVVAAQMYGFRVL